MFRNKLVLFCYSRILQVGLFSADPSTGSIAVGTCNKSPFVDTLDPLCSHEELLLSMSEITPTSLLEDRFAV